MKKLVIDTLAWIVVVSVLAGCDHTTEPPAAGKSPVQKPAAKKSPVQEVVIQIAQDGTVTVAGEKCAPAQLATKLSGLGVKQAIVHVDPGAADTQVTAVMDACKAAGVEQVHGILNAK